jgi:hypothetical protein
MMRMDVGDGVGVALRIVEVRDGMSDSAEMVLLQYEGRHSNAMGKIRRMKNEGQHSTIQYNTIQLMEVDVSKRLKGKCM